MNHLSSISNVPFITSSGIEFVSNSPAGKRPIDQPKEHSTKRVKRQAERVIRQIEKQQLKKLAEKITLLITQAKTPDINPQELKKIQEEITSNKLAELRIVHSHTKKDANKLHAKKILVDAEVASLKAELKSTKEKLASREAELTQLLTVHQQFAYEIDLKISTFTRLPETHAKEKSELEAKINNMQNQIDTLNYDLNIINSELQFMTESYASEIQIWEETVDQMKMQHAQELKEKDTALEAAKKETGSPGNSTKTLKVKIATLMKRNTALAAENKRKTAEIDSLTTQNTELAESETTAEAELLVMRKANARLSELKQESDSRYQALLKDLGGLVDRRK